MKMRLYILSALLTSPVRAEEVHSAEVSVGCRWRHTQEQTTLRR